MNAPKPARAQLSRRPASALLRHAPILRREQLRNQLPGIVNVLGRRRADLVPEGFIADYVALDWLEWNGGALRITLTGSNICRQMQARQA